MTTPSWLYDGAVCVDGFGEKCGPMRPNDLDDDPDWRIRHPWTDGIRSYTTKGRYIDGKNTRSDLIGPWVEPAEADDDAIERAEAAVKAMLADARQSADTPPLDEGDEQAWLDRMQKFAGSFASSEVEFFEKLKAERARVAAVPPDSARQPAEAGAPEADRIAAFKIADGWSSDETMRDEMQADIERAIIAARESSERDRDRLKILLQDEFRVSADRVARAMLAEARIAELEADAARLDWLENHPAAELVRRVQDGWEDDVQWEVCEIHGGRNDREWHLRGVGETVRDALDAALKSTGDA